MAHGNIRFPELHDKAQLEDLVRRFGSGTRIARYLGCKRQNVDTACKKLGVQKRRYVMPKSQKGVLKML